MLKRIFFVFLCLTIVSSGFFTQNSFVKKAEAAVLLQDDFSGTEINTAIWDEIETGGAGGSAGNIQQNDQLSLTGPGNAWGANMLQTKNIFSRSADVLKVSLDMTVANCTGSAPVSTVALVYGGPTPTSPSIFAYYSAGRIQLKSFNTTQTASTDWVCTNNVPFNMRLELPQAGGAQLYINDVLEGTLTTSTLTNAKFSLQGYGTTTAFIDNIEISQGVDDPTEPAVPTSLNATAGDTEVGLAWSAPYNGGSAITDYIVEYKLTSEPTTWTSFDDGVSVTTSATVTSLTNDSSYDFRVTAVNAIGAGDSSSIVSATPAAPGEGGGGEEAGLLEDLISHWNLNEASGATRADSQGSNNLTASGTSPAAVGKLGNAFAPTGAAAGGTLSAADNASLSMGSHDFTLSAWVKYDVATATSRGIAIKWGASAPNEYGLYSYSTNKFRFIVNGSGGYTMAESPDAFSADTWYFLVGWYDSTANTVNLKINNGSTISVPFTGGVVSDGTNPLTIGSFNGGNYLDGSIDSVSLWKRALTSQEMTALYNNGNGLDYPFDGELAEATEPDAPTALSATAGDAQVNLSWSVPAYDGGSSITDYVIEYKLTSEPTVWTVFEDGISTTTSTTVSGLTNDSSYDFRVSAVNTIGTSAASEIDSATPLEGGTGFSGDPIFEDDFTGTVIDTTLWDTTGSASQNNNLALVGNQSWGANMLQTKDTFDRTNGDLVAQATFTLANCAVSGNTVALVYGGPTINTDGYFAYYHDGQARLAGFGGASGSVGTGWSCANNVPFTMALVVKQGGGADLYINNDLKLSNATGTFSNLKFSLQGFSAASSIVDDFSILALGAPSTPQNVVATAGNGQVGLTWDASTGNGSAVTDYRIDYKTSAASTWTTFNDGTSTDTAATVTGLINGVTYNFRIYALSAVGQSGASTTATATPVSATPAAPQAVSVAITGFPAIGEALSGSYIFADPNGDSEAGSTVRWLISDTADGIYAAIAGATTAGYTPVEADLGKYIKFEVTPVSNTSPTNGTPSLSSAYGPITETSFLNTIISTGQSLAIGRVGSPALSTTQPYNNVMLSGAGSGPTNDTGGGGRGLGTSLIPLVEVGQESIGSSMANGITHLTGDDDYQIGVINNANGGTAYSGLKKGSARYTLGMGQLDNISAAAEDASKQVRVIAVTNIHGETDNMNGVTYEQYKDYLVEWQADYQTDVFAKTGQTGILPMFTDQMSTCSSPYSNGKTTCHIAQAQLDASEENPGKIILVTPKYFFDYIDQHHLTNSSYRWLGEYYAKVMYKVLIEHEDWRPLSPDLATLSGNEILVDFHVPAGQLQFDTTMEPLKANYGFEYYDSTASATISSVEIVDADTVKVTLSNVPTGSNPRIRYAYTGDPAVYGGTEGSARGNLRDTDPAPSQYGNTLYDWAVHFDEPLVIDDSAPTITSVTTDTADGTYGIGDTIDIDVNFSTAVTSTGNVTVTLETGATDRTCTFTVTNATTGTCDYTVQEGDTTSDLNVSLISGDIKDSEGNAMISFTPATNLAQNHAINISTGASGGDLFNDLGYNYLFKADYNGNANDTSEYGLTSTGSVVGYVTDGSTQAAQFAEASNSGLSYATTAEPEFRDGLYDDDGFTLVTRYRVDNQTAVGSYTGAVAGMYATTGNNRSWLMTHRPASSNDTTFATTATGSSPVAFTNITTNLSSQLGQWATAVVTYDGSGEIKTYYNSAEVVATTSASIYEPTADFPALAIGHFPAVNSSMNGLIDYVYLLDKGMTQADVNAFYNYDPDEEEEPPADSYTLTYSAGDNGTVTGTLSQTVEPDGSGTEVTAVPDEGYMFMGWSDGDSVNPRIDVDVNNDVNVTARFAIITGLDNDPAFLEDLGYQHLFRADYSNSTTNSVGGTTPTGEVEGYVALPDGYAANFTQIDGSSLSYAMNEDLYSGMYDEDGFTLLARYRLDSLFTTTAPYAGAVASVFDHTTNNRSWLLTHKSDNNTTQLATSANGTSVNLQNVRTGVNNDLGEWATVVITYDGSGQVRAYQSSSTQTSTYNGAIYAPADTVPLVVGSFFNGSMTGLIDYVHILDKGMSATDVGAYFDQEPGEEEPPGNGDLVELTNQSFVNSDGLRLYYDLYYVDNVSGPIALVSDSWTSNRSSYTSQAKSLAQNYGFMGVALDTRGKSSSQGKQDALGYECRDVYELIEHIKATYPAYYDEDDGAHMFGFSGAGGRSLMCSGRYPDYFTSVYATGSVASLTGWYLANVATSSTDRSQMRERTGNSINPGVAKYYPTGGETAVGATENQEAYTARSADEISAYNTLSNVYITYQTGDPRVPQTLSLGYITNWNNADKDSEQELVNFACSGSTHAICDLSGGYEWMNNHRGVLTIPDTGNFKIGGWVETKKFRVEFLDDVGYVGDVDYDLSNGEFEFAIDANTYTGPTEVLVKDVTNDLVLYDGDTMIGELVNGALVNDNEAYNITYSGDDLRIVIPTLSSNTIRGLAPADSEAPVISDFSVSTTATTATITWTTDELASSQVAMGLLDHLALSPETDTAPRVTNHSVTVTDLVPCTLYAIQAFSTDADANTSDIYNASTITAGCAGNSSVVESSSVEVNPATGGQVDLPGVSANGSIGVPAGATGSNVIYQIKALNQNTALDDIDSPDGVVVASGYVYDLKAYTQAGVPVTSFDEPITVTLSYSDSEVSGLDESSLVIYHYSGGSWTALNDCVVNTVANTVTCTTTGFSLFGIFGTSTTTPGSSSTVSSGSVTKNKVGTNIVSADGTIYTLTADGYRRPYTSAGAYLSYGFNSWANAVPAKAGDMKLPVGPFIAPRDGSITCSDRGTDAGTCYLITEGKKAGFTSEAVFKALGFSFANALYGDVSFMPSADNISSSAQAHRAGVLVNNNGTLQIVGANSGELVGIPSMATLASWGYNTATAVMVNSYDKALNQTKVLADRAAGVLNF